MNLFERLTCRSAASVLLVLGATVATDGVAAADGPDAGALHLHAVSADFDAIRFGIESAIENRGYVIDYHARVGDMLERTAGDVGAGETPYHAAETWQFCSATLSRRMVEADPANIAYCPFVVFAYETRDAPGTVVVGFRPGPGEGEGESADAFDDIDRELAAIVAEATE